MCKVVMVMVVIDLILTTTHEFLLCLLNVEDFFLNTQREQIQLSLYSLQLPSNFHLPNKEIMKGKIMAKLDHRVKG